MIRATVVRALVLTAAFAAALTPVRCALLRTKIAMSI
jgi:hypothetical protein